MNAKILWILFLLNTSVSFGQIENKLEYCNCIDKIEKNKPQLDGRYERICNGITIETGSFKNGGKDGEWITYSKKGTLLRKINYYEGKLNGPVEIYFLNTKPKVKASFVNGKKNGFWTYYAPNGNVFMEGEYVLDKPIKIWTLKDEKGKKILVQYDFSTSKHIVNEASLFAKHGDIIKSDNAEEFFILTNPNRLNILGTSPLGGYYLAGDLFANLVEIPLDYWDTYTEYIYKAAFKISSENICVFSLEKLDEAMPARTLSYPFIIRTNRDKKIKITRHSELSETLLYFKINEALNLMTPWIFSEETNIEVYIPYLLNQD